MAQKKLQKENRSRTTKNIQEKKEGWKSISKTSNEEKIKVASEKRKRY